MHSTLRFIIDPTISQRLSHEVGWGYKDVVDRLEEKRKIKAQAYFERKVSFLQSERRPLGLVLINYFRVPLLSSARRRQLMPLLRSRSSLRWVTRLTAMFLYEDMKMWHTQPCIFVYG